MSAQDFPGFYVDKRPTEFEPGIEYHARGVVISRNLEGLESGKYWLVGVICPYSGDHGYEWREFDQCEVTPCTEENIHAYLLAVAGHNAISKRMQNGS